MKKKIDKLARESEAPKKNSVSLVNFHVSSTKPSIQVGRTPMGCSPSSNPGYYRHGAADQWRRTFEKLDLHPSEIDAMCA